MEASIEVGTKRRLRRRRIIERSRLHALLDESSARIRTLIAPAGYGKTTLAEHWVAKKGRRGTWFTARPSSTDVAALALGLARSASAIVADCDGRLREHLRALPAPDEHADVLAELLGEDLAPWPSDAWLVLDDYHEIAATADAEHFVETLVAASPIQLLIASRQRPTWITARRILYGEILELNQNELAMDGREAAEVLVESSSASASGLVALASGWPAVIGLASVTGAEIAAQDSVPESLYQFFAEEVFDALEDAVQVGLATLAIAPVIDLTLASKLLGDDAESICASALDVGILVERDGRFEIHPLARAFLDNMREHAGGSASVEAVAACIDHFRARGDWDAAFDVIARSGQPTQVESLLEKALDELLDTARLSTIESWCDHADSAGSTSAISSLGRAEVALRRGHLGAAQAYAQSVISESPYVQFQALSAAGRAAHLSSREEEALELFRRAEAIAPSEALRREAVTCEVSCLTDLERPDAVLLFEELAASADPSSPRDLVRVADRRLYMQIKLDVLDLTEADRAHELVGAVSDPLVRSSFLSVYAAVLALAARYQDALRVADSLLAIARQYRLDFAIPYALCSAGIGHAGQRSWDDAELSLTRGLQVARDVSDAHAEYACAASLVRVLTQQGRFHDALDLVRDCSRRPVRPVLVQVHAEFVASEALALGASGRIDDALRTVEPVRGLSKSVDARILIAAVDATAGVKRHDADAIERVNDLHRAAVSTGGLDHLVTTYRAVPEVVAVLLRTLPHDFGDLLRRVGDEDLAQPFGYVVSHGPARALLTAREREVLELVRESLTNREIARLLYIAEPTVKLHVQHIFDKLGVRSRKAIAMQAALERSQATSAIDETSEGTDS